VGAFIPAPGQPDPRIDPNFKSTSLPAITRFKWSDVDPPSPLYVLRDDLLFLEAILGSTPSTEVVTFNYRFLRVPEVQGGQPSDLGQPASGRTMVDYGIIDTGQDVIALAGGPLFKSTTRTLGEGYLLSVSAIPANALQRGQTFVRVAIVRGGVNISNAAQILLADYITVNGGGGWPYGRVLNPVEGPGAHRSLQVANPAAGTDFIMTTPANTQRTVTSFSAVFTAAAAVASRNINIIVDDGANIVWQDDVSAAVTATQAVTVNGAQNTATVGIVATTLFVLLPPNLKLEPGWRVRSSTAAIQGLDQWSAIWFNVEDWIESL
jgi:hypothetical protein